MPSRMANAFVRKISIASVKAGAWGGQRLDSLAYVAEDVALPMPNPAASWAYVSPHRR